MLGGNSAQERFREPQPSEVGGRYYPLGTDLRMKAGTWSPMPTD